MATGMEMKPKKMTAEYVLEMVSIKGADFLERSPSVWKIDATPWDKWEHSRTIEMM
jgi:hypothetical protein